MKNNNRKKALVTALRLLTVAFVGFAISLAFIYLLFEDSGEIIDLLFSADLNAITVMLVIVSWVFGSIIGLLVSCYVFIGMFVEKQQELDLAKEEISSLKRRLKMINQNRNTPSSQRIMAQLENNTSDSASSGNEDDEDFLPLQRSLELLKNQQTTHDSEE